MAMLVSLQGKLRPKQQPYPHRRQVAVFWKVSEQPSRIFRMQGGYASIRSFPAVAARGRTGLETEAGFRDRFMTAGSRQVSVRFNSFIKYFQIKEEI